MYEFSALSVNSATELFEEFDQLYRCMTLAVGKNSSPGILFGQGKLLHLLCTSDGISQRELSRRASLSPPTVAEMLDKLESAALIERKRDTDDARRCLIYITASGKASAEEMSAQCEQQSDKLFSALTDSERTQLYHLLSKLRVSLVNDEPSQLKNADASDTAAAHSELSPTPSRSKIRRGIRLS